MLKKNSGQSLACQRLDLALVAQGLAQTPAHAQGMILAGQVRVNGQVVTKAGHPVKPTDVLTVASPGCPYVSRGGLKLEAALKAFTLNPASLTLLDGGASTGGFTDCLLQNGAAHVFAVDVGYGLLDWKIQQDERVTVMDRTNLRHLSPPLWQSLGHSLVDAAVTDVSFISLTQVLPVLASLIKTPPQNSQAGWMVALLKPQFECKAFLTPVEFEAFDGVLKDDALQKRVLEGTLEKLKALLPQWQLAGLEVSPLKGGASSPTNKLKGHGNKEWLTLWRYVG